MASFKKILAAVSVIFMVSALTADVAAHAKTKNKNNESTQTAISNVLKNLKEASLEGNSQKMASLWTEDAKYIDDCGDSTSGRNAIEARFARALDVHKAESMEFKQESFRMLSDSIAQSEGVVSRKDRGEALLKPSTRYLMTFTKKDGNWLISSATETPIGTESKRDCLGNLEWLIGDWTVKNKDGLVKMKANWIGGRNFIHCTFEVEKPNEDKIVEAQLIGWDPIREAPISWQFEANGGYGQGLWENKNGKWFIQNTGVGRDGSTNSSLTEISQNDSNSFSWQAKNRVNDGFNVPDSVLLKVTRVASSK